MRKVAKDIPVKNFPKKPSFYDRKPTIESKPVTPRWTRYGNVGPDGRELEKRNYYRDYYDGSY